MASSRALGRADARPAIERQPAAPVVPLDSDPLVVLRQLYLLTIRDGLITRARVYCPGPRNEAPDVDLERQARASGLAGAAPARSH